MDPLLFVYFFLYHNGSSVNLSHPYFLISSAWRFECCKPDCGTDKRCCVGAKKLQEKVAAKKENRPEFTMPRVQKLWEEALNNTKFSEDELLSLKEELHHFDHRLRKVTFQSCLLLQLLDKCKLLRIIVVRARQSKIVDKYNEERNGMDD